MRWLEIALGIAALCTYLELYHQDLLEESSAILIRFLQSYSNHTVDIAFKILGEITGVLFLVASGVAFLCGYREIGVLGSYAGFLGAALSGTLKMLILHPRPFWKYADIEILSCPHDWGSPSGHALSGGASMIVLAYYWLQNRHNVSGKVLILSTCILITGVDRVYLGAHFYFQVILGYSYSAVVGLYFLQSTQIKTIEDLRWNKNKLMKEHVKILLFSLISGAIYSYQTIVSNSSWENNYKAKCNSEFTAEGVMIKNICEAMYLWIVAGFLVGYHFNKEKKPNFSKLLVVSSTILYAVLVLYIVIVDKIILLLLPSYLRILVICANRYIGGFITCYYFPKIFCRVFGSSEESKTN